MSAIEINAGSSICRKCGTAFSRLKGYFPVSYSYLYKGTGYLPYCRECVDNMFAEYLAVCHDYKAAARQMCRKLDLYWSDNLFDQVEKQSSTRSIMTSYITKINGVKQAGKSYDDTLREEGVLWVWPGDYSGLKNNPSVAEQAEENESDGEQPFISEDIITFWGPGYTPKMYLELQERYDFFVSGLPDGVDLDVGTKALIRQIAAAELDINKDRAAGKSVDKKQTALNTLLNNTLLKPAQKNDDSDSVNDNTPFGVWIRKWENQRPIPEPDPELKDVDGIVRYIEIWFKGHLSKMLNIKNTYSKMYEDEIAKLRIDKPEYEDDEDETFFNDVFSVGQEAEEI